MNHDVLIHISHVSVLKESLLTSWKQQRKCWWTSNLTGWLHQVHVSVDKVSEAESRFKNALAIVEQKVLPKNSNISGCLQPLSLRYRKNECTMKETSMTLHLLIASWITSTCMFETWKEDCQFQYYCTHIAWVPQLGTTIICRRYQKA